MSQADTALKPLHVDVAGGNLAAVMEPGTGAFTIVLMHDLGGDLDTMQPLLACLPLAEAHRIALDMPNHGLSCDCPEGEEAAIIGTWLDELAKRGWGPFVLAASGSSSAVAWQLAARDNIAGICLISPVEGTRLVEHLPRAMPLIAFVAGGSPDRLASWQRYRARTRGRWLSVSTTATHEQLLAFDPDIRAQVASHLAGFAREAYMLSLQST